MSAPCLIAGNPDMYGLGIRVSFYLMWICTLCLGLLEQEHIAILYVGELVLDAAVFLGLVMAASVGHLQAAEVYIVMLLLSTTVYLFFPRHAADLVMVICPHLGLRLNKRAHENYVAAARSLYGIVIVGLQLWFWISEVDYDGKGGSCQQFGFLFGPIDLNNAGLKAMHIIVLILALGCGVLIEWKFYRERIKDKGMRKM